MFKAIDRATGRAVICLDDCGQEWAAGLRQKSHAGDLLCQTCKEPVQFKAGQERRPHFAHKSLGNCPSRDESPVLLEARAALYGWLRSKFGEKATLEKQLEGNLPRPVDCWAQHQDGRQFAYWILLKRMGWMELDAIEAAIKKAGACLNWVFPFSVLKRLGDTNQLKLSTMERERMKKSEFDCIYGQAGGGTLHYLDPDGPTLRTFRGVVCVHYPQGYAGQELCTPLNAVLVYPTTGEFVRPGEYEQLKALRDEQERRRAQETERRKSIQAVREQLRPHRATVDEPRRTRSLDAEQAEFSCDGDGSPPESTCVCTYCKQVTAQWVVRNPDGSGVCRTCSNARDEARKQGRL